MTDKVIQNFFNKGMVSDTHPSVQNNNTYRYALNAIVEGSQTGRSGLQNEQSNVLFARVPGRIVGYSFIEERDKFLVFHIYKEASVISWVDILTKKVTEIAKDSEFKCNWGFSECEWIYAESKTMSPCNELNVYWSSNNTYRTINVDVLLDPKRRKILKCKDFQLFHSICAPVITATVVEGGGFDIAAGAYQFVAQLEDNDGKTSNWFYAGEPAYITSPNNIPGEVSTQSIKLSLTDLDPRFNKVNIALIRTVGGVIDTKLIDSRFYTSNGITIQYYGTTGKEEPINISEILTKTRKYFKGKDLLQKDGQLFIYNLLHENNLNYQTRANNIDVEWVAYRISHEDANSHKSLMRDEVYAPAIVWNYCDGTSSFAYHIPAKGDFPTVTTSCNVCNTVSIQDNNSTTKTNSGERLMEKSTKGYTSNRGNTTYNPQTQEAYPASQDYDYDRFKEEVDAGDPTIPATNHTGPGDNAVTDSLGSIRDTLNSGSINVSSTGSCESCAKNQTDSAHNLAKDAISGLGDLTSNLQDDSGNTADSNGSIIESASNIINDALNNEEVRTADKGKFYSLGENLENTSSSSTGSNSNPGLGGPDSDIEQRSKSLFNGVRCENLKPAEIASGRTGMYVSTETYPLTLDCEGNRIYGDLAGKKIRHHRMPDNKTIPHFYSTQNGVPNKFDVNNLEVHNSDAVVLGLRISNIEFPSEDELPKPLCPNSPYKIVYVKRDDTNKSIIAKGIFTHIFEGKSHGRNYAFAKHAVNSRDYIDRSIVIDQDDSSKLGVNSDKSAYTFHSPDTTYDTPPLAVDAIKPELEYFGSGWRHGMYASGEAPLNIYENQIDQRGTRQAINLNHYVCPISTAHKCVTGITYAPGNKVVLNPEGIDLPLMNLWRESSVYLQTEGNPMELVSGIDGGTSDMSFLGDGLDHECPIPYAGAIYGSLKRHIPNQYGSLVNQKYADLGLNATAHSGFSIEGICGDVWIGMHSFKRTSYISNKIGENIETDKLPSPEYTGLMKYFMIGDCTELPKSGDISDPKNSANLRPGKSCHIDGSTDPGAPETDIYYPKVLKTLVSFWVESEVNVWNKATGEAELGEVSYPKLKELELDSRVNSVPWTKAYLNRFYVEVRRPSKWKLALATTIRALVNMIPATMFATDVFDIDSVLDAGFTSIEAIMTGGIWVVLNFLLFTPKNIRRILGLPECEPDRRGGNLNEEVQQWEDNYKKYNYDYSLVNDKNIHLGTPDPYNTCVCTDNDNCDNTQYTSNEIYSSNRQIVDSPYDAYQNFEANDYLAITGDSGRLTKLFIESERFYAHTTDGIYLLQYSNGSISLGERVALLGSGSLLANPQKYMSNVQEGFLGLKDPNASISTSYGYFFIDQEARMIFKFQGGQATPISGPASGMYNFFKENLGFCKSGDCCDDEKNLNKGSFYTLGVDYRHNRILFTKNDLNHCGSYTVSYDVLTESWISFHSYLPQFYLWDRNRMWSVNNNSIYEHNIGSSSHQEFYGVYYDFIVEFVAKLDTLDPFKFRSTMLDTQMDILGTSTLLDRDTTFTGLSLRNTLQSTGELNLITRASSDGTESPIAGKIKDRAPDVHVVRQQREWRINEVHDYVIDADVPLTIKDCPNCNDTFEHINQDNISYEILQEQKYTNRILFGKYLVYRYTLNNPNINSSRLLLRSNRTFIEQTPR